MNEGRPAGRRRAWPALVSFPLPAKALATATILAMAIAMVGALGQIILHDIIPTFFPDTARGMPGAHRMEAPHGAGRGKTADLPTERGDLLSRPPSQERGAKPFYEKEQFVWVLRWSHIHLFGMNMIFVFMGAITLFLDLDAKLRAWLIALPFVGVQIDIATVWLKTYVSPVFFWLHLPGGGVFGAVFLLVSARALYEMWWQKADGRKT